MEQRIYRENIDPSALEEYLVGIFHQRPTLSPSYPISTAQKINQSESIYVQIMRAGDWNGHEHGALSVRVLSIAGGVSISMGQADWLDLDHTDQASSPQRLSGFLLCLLWCIESPGRLSLSCVPGSFPRLLTTSTSASAPPGSR